MEESEKMSGAGVSIPVYVGSNEKGIAIKRMIKERGEARNMNRSEYVLFCILEQIKREDEEKANGTGKSR